MFSGLISGTFAPLQSTTFKFVKNFKKNANNNNNNNNNNNLNVPFTIYTTRLKLFPYLSNRFTVDHTPEIFVRMVTGVRDFSMLQTPRPALRPIQWVTRTFSPGVRRPRSWAENSHHLVPRFRISGLLHAPHRPLWHSQRQIYHNRRLINAQVF